MRVQARQRPTDAFSVRVLGEGSRRQEPRLRVLLGVDPLLRPLEGFGEELAAALPLRQLGPQVVLEVVGGDRQRCALWVLPLAGEARQPVPSHPCQRGGLTGTGARLHDKPAGRVRIAPERAHGVDLPSVRLDAEAVAGELHRITAPCADALARLGNRLSLRHRRQRSSLPGRWTRCAQPAACRRTSSA